MKKQILILFSLILSLAAFAQKGGNWEAKIKEIQEYKIQYLIQEMDLPSDKQAEFTRLYTAYDNARTALFRSFMQQDKAMKAKENPSEADYAEAAQAMATAKLREGELENSYYLQFKQMLTPKQLYNMKRAENRFEHKLREAHQGQRKTKKGKK